MGRTPSSSATSSACLICLATWVCALLGLFVLLAPMPAAPANIKSYAFVNDDGTLKVRGKIIHLYGIHIPTTSRTCNQQFRPPVCAPRAARALKFKLSSGFVDCEPRVTNADRSIVALCRVKDIDLSAYLLERGWAVALPDAPIEYQTLEKIARSRGMGVWGLPIGE